MKNAKCFVIVLQAVFAACAVAGVNPGLSLYAAPQATQAAPVVTIPAGTQIIVRTIEAIDGNTAKAGARYRASIAETVAVGSQAVIFQGSACTLEVVSIESGKEMALRLREVIVNGKSYSLSTDFPQVEAEGTSKSTSAVKRGVGLGALGAGIGALAGGGKGAAIGAAVGGGVGAVSAAGAKGKQINLPSETRLLFSLKAPVPMN